MIFKEIKRRIYCHLKKRKTKFDRKKRRVDPTEYIFYSIFNTSLYIDQGTTASMIARSFLRLHNKLESDHAKNTYIDMWAKSGEKMIILEGYNHKHLKYLKEEASFPAIDTHILFQQCKRSQVIAVLTVFGKEENLEDIFEGLEALQ